MTDFRLTDVSHNQGQMYAVSNVLIVGKQRPDDPTQWATEVSLKIGSLRGIKKTKAGKKREFISIQEILKIFLFDVCSIIQRGM